MLPRITIISPTLNHACFIEQTINSVLNQKYPDLEYIVVDGGSTDGTMEILKKYDKYVTWISETDNGQVDAINKGLRKADGEIVAYLNTDDFYAPGALLKIGTFFRDNPTAQIVTGKCQNVDIVGKPIRSIITIYKNAWLFLGNTQFLKILNYIAQPATFWRKSLHSSIGYFNLSYRYAMDYDFWLRAVSNEKLHFINSYLASFRIHPASITSSNSRGQFLEEYEVAKQYSNTPWKALHRMHGTLSYFLYEAIFNKRGMK